MRKLLEVLHRLADLGNSIVIIEHNLDVIRNADWVLDLGPEGGEGGGRLIAEGRPANVAAVKGSYTGDFLRRYFTPDQIGNAAAELAAELDALATGKSAAPVESSGQPREAKSRSKKTAAIKDAGPRAPRKKKTGIA